MKRYLLAILVIATVASCSKKIGAGKVNAATVFANNCARCHGSNGLNGKAPHLDKVGTKDEVANIITNGKGTHMPAFKDKLTTKEIDAVTGYVMAISKAK